MLVSLIIPTRDRAEYLRHSLAAALTIKSDDVEILISDNASVDDTHDVIHAFEDKRLRYINTGQRLSMRQNFEYALEESRGDYVIFTGDDDSILPGQFGGLCKALAKHSPDALSWDFPVYGWPVDGVSKKSGGFRIVHDRVFGQPTELDLAERRNMLRKGELYHFHPIPAIYHGCMSRSFIKDKLAAPDGMCILARSPDTYISMRALQHGGRFMHCRHPFSMNGYGSKSTGGSFGSLGRENKPEEKPKETQFETEIRGDPVEDVMPLANSVTLGFLSTLETVRHHFPDPPIDTDYVAWYRTVLHEISKKDKDVSDQVMRVMTEYATSSGSQDALQQALKAPRIAIRQIKAQWHKNADKLKSFRISGEIDGVNTIATAVRRCDNILGAGFEDVFDGRTDRRGAWSEAKARKAQMQA